MSLKRHPAEDSIGYLRQGAGLVRKLDDDLFTRSAGGRRFDARSGLRGASQFPSDDRGNPNEEAVIGFARARCGTECELVTNPDV